MNKLVAAKSALAAKAFHEEAHAKLSASGSERWLNCPGSIKMSEGLPEEPESEWAAEGTKAHELLELWLVHMRDKMGGFVIPKGYETEMVDAVRLAVEDVKARYKPGDHELLIEERVSLAHIHEDMFGTADISILEHFGVLDVTDYKHGAGHVVETHKIKDLGGIKIKDHNTQLVYYALGIAHMYDYNFDSARLRIIQPRAWTPDGEYIREVSLTMRELKSYNDLFRKGVDRVYAKDPKTAAGPWCRWCPARHTCPTLSKSAFEDALIEFDEVQDGTLMLPEPKKMTPKQISKLLASADLLEFWIQGVRNYAFHQLSNGQKIPDFKLVRGRGSRYWKDESKAADFLEVALGDDAFKRKMLSPAQAEKLIKNKKVLDKYIGFSQGSPCIAKASDKRHEINTAELIAAEFDEGVETNGTAKKTKISAGKARKKQRK